MVEDIADRLEKAAKTDVSEFQEYLEKATPAAAALKATQSKNILEVHPWKKR